MTVVARSEDAATKIEKIRARRESRHAVHAAIASAPAPRADAIARLDAQIEARLAEVLPTVSGFATADFDPRTMVGPLVLAESADALLLWLDRTAFRTRAIEALDAWYRTNPPGLPDRERAAKLAELAAEDLRDEVSEEECIRDAEARGLAFERRPDAAAVVLIASDLARVRDLDHIPADAIAPTRVHGFRERNRRLHAMVIDLEERVRDARTDVRRREEVVTRHRVEQTSGRARTIDYGTPGVQPAGSIDVVAQEEADATRAREQLTRLAADLAALREQWSTAARLAEIVERYVARYAPEHREDGERGNFWVGGQP